MAPLLCMAFLHANDKRIAPWPPMRRPATLSSTMLLSISLCLMIQVRSCSLLLVTALLFRLLRCRCQRRRCPCAHIILTHSSSGRHLLPASRSLLGREMCSSPSSQPPSNSSRIYPTIAAVTLWSSLGSHTKRQNSLQSIALHLRHALGCALWLQLHSR